jgi:DNA polymerase III subunit epsilon
MRQIIFDTETTGLEPAQGHRVIEIGLVELVNRRPTGRTFHRYLNPERPVDEGAKAVHGLSDAFLAEQPKFADIAADFIAFIRGAELIAHNASFDVGFLDHELGRLPEKYLIADLATVTDTLELARKLHPGQRNSLDALCKRYAVDNSNREYHGALLDARLLADVYLAMTGGQSSLILRADSERSSIGSDRPRRHRPAVTVPIVRPSEAELALHEAMLDRIHKASKGQCVFRTQATPALNS